MLVMLLSVGYSNAKRQQSTEGKPPPISDTSAEASNTNVAQSGKPPPTQDKVILSLALNWADLWREGATLDEVNQADRDETINEVLVEIGNKMKRRNQAPELTAFKVKKVQQNLALVEYPQLSGFSEIDLNLIANELLQLGGSVINVNIFVNNQAIQIVDLGMGGQGQNYHNEEHIHHDHDGIVEGPPSTDRQMEHHEYEDHHEVYHHEIGSIEDQM